MYIFGAVDRSPSSNRSLWVYAVLFLVASRILLNIPGLIGANVSSLSDGASVFAREQQRNVFPNIWARWDSGYYLQIARQGYSLHGDEVNFFPAYPIAIRIFSLGYTSLMSWVGFLISNLAFIAAIMLLWQDVGKDYNHIIAWNVIVTILVFPTSFFFSAIYAESLFLLFSILVYLFSKRGYYALAGLFVSLASITRIYGFLLALIPIVDILKTKPRTKWLQLGSTITVSFAGLVLYMFYLWLTQGSPIAFVTTQQGNMNRSVTLPGLSLLHSFGVMLWGYGGFQDNWFMRVGSLQDLLAILLFLGCAVASFRLLKQKSLAVYLAISLVLLSSSHGPYTLGVFSMSRYILVLFPGFIVLGIWLERIPRLKWAIWAFSYLILWFLTAWFANGRWVA